MKEMKNHKGVNNKITKTNDKYKNCKTVESLKSKDTYLLVHQK